MLFTKQQQQQPAPLTAVAASEPQYAYYGAQQPQGHAQAPAPMMAVGASQQQYAPGYYGAAQAQGPAQAQAPVTGPLTAYEGYDPSVWQARAPSRMDVPTTDLALAPAVEASAGDGCGEALSCNRHKKLKLLTLAIVATAIVAFAFDFILLIATGILYLFYLWEINTSAAAKYLDNMKNVQDTNQHFNAIRSKPLVLWFSIQNYHYRTTHRNGKRQRKRVNTHFAKGTFVYNSWRDVSPVYPDFTKYQMTKTKMEIGTQFGDEFTATEYQRQKQYLYSTNTRDKRQAYREGVEVEGFMPKMLVEMDEAKRPCWLSQGHYWLASLFLCSLCWRTLMDSRTGVVHYKFEKQVWAVPNVMPGMVPMMPAVVNPVAFAPPPYAPQPEGVELQVGGPPAYSTA